MFSLNCFTGIISCNGDDGVSQNGGASGGSIKLTTGTLSGSGKIQANGGKGTIFHAHSALENMTYLNASDQYFIISNCYHNFFRQDFLIFKFRPLQEV